MNTGLSSKDLQLICHAIAKYPQINQAKIFGSRAKGNYKQGSDVDIALYIDNTLTANEKKSIILQLHQQLDEELPLPYFFDLIDVDSIQNKQLLEHIERVGIALINPIA